MHDIVPRKTNIWEKGDHFEALTTTKFHENCRIGWKMHDSVPRGYGKCTVKR
jgi:hypothetical protein